MFYSSSTIEADRLASLALNAATQLDMLNRGRNIDASTIMHFADAIAHFSGVDGETEDGASWLDPATSEMFSNAVTLSTAKRIIDVSELNDELRDLVNRLRAQPDGMSIDELKRFCLAVHDFILRSRSNVGLHERGVFDYDHSY